MLYFNDRYSSKTVAVIDDVTETKPYEKLGQQH